MSTDRHVETLRAEWNGIGIRITWEPSWLNLGDCLGHDDMGHPRVHGTAPEKAPLPITETAMKPPALPSGRLRMPPTGSSPSLERAHFSLYQYFPAVFSAASIVASGSSSDNGASSSGTAP